MIDPMVICYHAVSQSWDAPEAVTPDQLERQLTHLKRRGWRAVPFREAVLAEPGARTLAVTFDDAFASVKRLAFPILSHLGMTATVFAPTSYVSAGALCGWAGLDRWAETPYAEELRPMSWSELGELTEAAWEIGSHTCTHPHLTRLDDLDLALELAESREASVPHLGYRLRTIAYPYGDVDERVANFASRTGYEAGAALTSRQQSIQSHRFPRIGIYRKDVTWRFRLKTASSVRQVRRSRVWEDLRAAA